MVLTPSQVSSGPIECVYTHSCGSQDSKHMAKPTHEWPLAILCLQPSVPKTPCTFPGPTIPLLFERLFFTPHLPLLSSCWTPTQLSKHTSPALFLVPPLRVPCACNSHSTHLPWVHLFPYLSPYLSPEKLHEDRKWVLFIFILIVPGIWSGSE